METTNREGKAVNPLLMTMYASAAQNGVPGRVPNPELFTTEFTNDSCSQFQLSSSSVSEQN